MRARERILEIVGRQPQDASYDAILHALLFERMVEWGLADTEAERVISSEEMEGRIDTWGE